MAFYTALILPPGSGGMHDEIEQARLLPEGFSWAAFVFTGLWLLSKRLWLATLLFALVWGGLYFARDSLGLAASGAMLAQFAIGLFLGLEGNNLIARKLLRQGWRLAAVVEARDLSEAERRFFERALVAAPVPVRDYSAAPARPQPVGSVPVIGLFPEAQGAMSQQVAIIDYGSGNLHSAAKAFERAAREAGLTATIRVTSDTDVVRAADRIVLPGVGAFADCRRGLDAVPGMVDVLEETVRRKGRPFLSICVGMQLLASRGLEYTVTPGLGWIEGDVALIPPTDDALKIPHMGWNTLHKQDEHALLDGIETGPNGLHAYFVHSYALAAARPQDVLALTEYGGPVTAVVARGNIAGTQFHPEKSQKLGLKLISNFLRWAP